MKGKIEIQRGWKNWLKDLASVSGFPQSYTGELMIELGREVDWALKIDNLEDSINAREDKINVLLEAHEGNINSFDPIWPIRLQFWEWMKG